MVRLVAFSDTWLWGVKVERGEDGKVHLDFKDFDNLADVVRSTGAEPYIRLAYNMPRALSSIQSDDAPSPSSNALLLRDRNSEITGSPASNNRGSHDSNLSAR